MKYSGIKAFQEELFETIKQRLLDIGIPDKGIALKVLSAIQKMKTRPYGTNSDSEDDQDPPIINEELKQELLSLGFEEWFLLYLDFIGRYDLEHKEQLVFDAYRLLYNIAYRKKLGIDETEYLETIKKNTMDKKPGKKANIYSTYIMWDAIRDKIESLKGRPRESLLP